MGERIVLAGGEHGTGIHGPEVHAPEFELSENAFLSGGECRVTFYNII